VLFFLKFFFFKTKYLLPNVLSRRRYRAAESFSGSGQKE